MQKQYTNDRSDDHHHHHQGVHCKSSRDFLFIKTGKKNDISNTVIGSSWVQNDEKKKKFNRLEAPNNCITSSLTCNLDYDIRLD